MPLRKLACACALAFVGLLGLAGAARADSGLGPADAEATLRRLSFLCVFQSLCPLSAANYETLQRAVAGHRADQYLLGLNLILGDGAPADRIAGMAWVVKAAEAGAPLAVRYVENKLQNGEAIEIDETKAATALKLQADAGDVQSMLTLGQMMIRGRGVAQDPQAGIALLRKSARHDSGGAIEYEIAELYLLGTNGLPHDHEEGMKWYAVSASHGNVDAMATLGGLWENRPLNDWIMGLENGHIRKPSFEPDIVQSYCWRMRAAMMGKPLAQYELALMRSRKVSDNRGNVIAPDLIQADFWFRLGARDREYDNSQVRGAIEPNMTTAQLDQVKKMVGSWRQLDFAQVKAAEIAIPGDASHTCPPMPAAVADTGPTDEPPAAPNTDLVKAFEASGFKGVWAVDCGSPADPKNRYVFRAVTETGEVVINSYASSQNPVETRVMERIEPISPGRFSITNFITSLNGKPTDSKFGKPIEAAVAVLESGKTRTIEDKIENGPVIISGGTFGRDKTDVPWFKQCSGDNIANIGEQLAFLRARAANH